MRDEEIQERLNRGEQVPGSEAQVYRKVFEALEREPDFVLPASFSADVMRRIDASSASSSKDVFWFCAGIAGCLIALAVSIWMTNFQFSVGAFKFISGYPGLVTFGVFIVFILHRIDRRLVKKTA